MDTFPLAVFARESSQLMPENNSSSLSQFEMCENLALKNYSIKL